MPTSWAWQGYNYACIAVGVSGSTIYAATETKLRALEDSSGAGLKVTAEIDLKSPLTQLALPPGQARKE